MRHADAEKPSLHDVDFYEWTQRTAELLRDHKFSELEVAHVAEEIADMGSRDRREIRNRLRVLISHLLKCQEASVRSKGWYATIAAQRDSIEELLTESPSLRRHIPDLVASVYRHAADIATYEMDLPANPFPLHCPFTIEQILGAEFIPE